jgi:hypothetical protein
MELYIMELYYYDGVILWSNMELNRQLNYICEGEPPGLGWLRTSDADNHNCPCFLATI